MVTLSEQDLQDAVAECAQALGYLVFHQRPCRRTDGSWYSAVQYSGVGFFDLTLIGRGRVVFAEIKSARGKVSPEQQRWHDHAKANGLDAVVWWPKDWLDGTIEEYLR